MAEGRGELEVYNQWFAAADADRDGVLSGAEAVQFFQRSGLPQNPTLFKVWQYVAGDRPSLSRQEFYTAMKLVSLAQLNGGQLDDQQALRLVNGLTGAVPLPRLAGMAVPRGIELPAHLLPQEPAAPGAAPASPAPGAAAPRAVPPASPPPPSAAFPPLSGEQAAAFQTAFSQLDTDGDGYVQGTDCFGAFMQSGLPKASLKHIWDLVAGDEPRLSRHQFVQALYLIDCVKRGMALPSALPPGPFPPVVGTVSRAAGTPSDIYSATLVIPPLPPRAAYQPQAPPPQPFASQVPGLPADRLAALDAADRMRLEAEREAALAKEAEQRKAEEERAAAAARREFFTRALGDMRLTQSKVNRAVVEAQQRCEMEQAAAAQMEADYDRAYAEFSVAHAASQPLVAALGAAQEQKAALQARLDSLRAMAAQLEQFDPEWETREKGECEALNLEIAQLSVRREQLERQAEATQRKREALLARVAGLQEAVASAESQLAGLTEEVDKVAAEGSQDKEAVVELLRRVAPLYNRLYSAAKAAMVPLPAEAVATLKREASPFQYDSLQAAHAADWAAFKDEGFKIVSALPVDTRLATFAAPSAAALEKDDAAAPPAAPAAEGSTPAPDAAPGAASDLPLESAASTAEAEAVSAAAEAGVLASAIAEALSAAPSKPASKQGSLSKGGAEAAAAVAAGEPAGDVSGPAVAASNPFEVGFGEDEAGGGADGAAAEAAPPAAPADAFDAFDAAAEEGGVDGPAEAAPPVKQASGAFGSSQALAVESPKATTAAEGDGGKAKEGAAPPSDSWTAF